MQSNVKVNKFTRMGQYVQIAFNETESVDEEENTTYHYESAKVKILNDRASVIQTLVRIKYKEIDAEFAANLNGGEEQSAHNEWRLTCKSIADEFETYITDIFS